MPMFDAAAGMAVETEATRPRIPRAATSAVLAFPNAADRRLSPTEPSSPTAGQSQPYNVGRFRRLVRRITQVREEGVSSRSRRGDGRQRYGRSHSAESAPSTYTWNSGALSAVAAGAVTMTPPRSSQDQGA